LILLGALWGASAGACDLGAGMRAAMVLGVACTGIACILYFRLIANVGAARALAVTYLVPMFGIFRDATLLHEWPGPRDVVGCVVILFGTALATGLLALPGRRAGQGNTE